MYQNIDGNKKSSKSLLGIIITLVAIVVIIGTTSIILKPETDDNKENPNYQKEELNNDNKEENTTSSNDKKEEKDPVKEEPNITQDQESYNNIIELSYVSFQEMIKDKRSFVVVISQTTCGHCIAYKPIYNEVLKEHNSKGYDLDILKLDKELRQNILDTLEVTGTPTTLIYIDGVVQKDKIEGITTKDKLESFLARYGFIS